MLSCLCTCSLPSTSLFKPIKTAAVWVSSRVFLFKLRAPWSRRGKKKEQEVSCSQEAGSCASGTRNYACLFHIFLDVQSSWTQPTSSLCFVLAGRSHSSVSHHWLANKRNFSITEYPGRISIWISTYRSSTFSSASKEFLLRERAIKIFINTNNLMNLSHDRPSSGRTLGTGVFPKHPPCPHPLVSLRH